MIKVNECGYGQHKRTVYDITVLGPKGYIFVPDSTGIIDVESAKNKFDYICTIYKKKNGYTVRLFHTHIVTEHRMMEESK